MEAIDRRLGQLENAEAKLYHERQATTHRRSLEDEGLLSRRQREDEEFSKALELRDQEEDVRSFIDRRTELTALTGALQDLRRQRRHLSRASWIQPEDPSGAAEGVECTAHSLRRVKRQLRSSEKPEVNYYESKYWTHSKKKRSSSKGLPVSHDSQSRALYTRPSDGKLVYLQCYVAGCERTVFETVIALRKHVCDLGGRHKMQGIFTDNSQAIEICGIAAPGQEILVSKPGLPSVEPAPIAVMAAPVTAPSMSESSIEFFQEGILKSGYDRSFSLTSGTLMNSDSGWKSPGAKGSQGSLVITRAQKAAEQYECSSSSDYEDEIMTQPARAYRRAKIDLKAGACKNGASSMHTATKPFRVWVDAQHESTDTLVQGDAVIAIKKEPTAGHDLLREQSADFSTPESKNAHSVVVSSSNDRLGNEVDEFCHTIHALGCKRFASEPPMSNLPPQNRLYSFEAP